ncbi:hypothetical protein EV360DRAFT_76500 [Lentinula raphanica]|nr:hypothetical protein EV360DRAFT_76500 [Lentinula raphanica]
MHLVAYLLLFIGCASNLYTLALPVAEADSGVISRSANELVPRDSGNKPIIVEWSTRGHEGTGIDNKMRDVVTRIFEEQVARSIVELFSTRKKKIDPRSITFRRFISWISVPGQPNLQKAYFRIHGLSSDETPRPYGRIDKMLLEYMDQYLLYLYPDEPPLTDEEPKEDAINGISGAIPYVIVSFEGSGGTGTSEFVPTIRANDYKNRIVDALDRQFYQNERVLTGNNRVMFVGDIKEAQLKGGRTDPRRFRMDFRVITTDPKLRYVDKGNIVYTKSQDDCLLTIPSTNSAVVKGYTGQFQPGLI